MFRLITIILIFMLCWSRNHRIGAVNHWIATKDGTIQPQIDSPFYLRRPHDLVAFLRQGEYLQLIVLLNAKLMLLKTELIKKMDQSDTQTIDFMYQTKCIINYLIQESDMYSTLKNKKYLNRINVKKINKNIGEENLSAGTISSQKHNSAMPLCEEVPFCMSCMEHLDGMVQRKKLSMAPELTLGAKEFGLATYSDLLTVGLKQEPQSWKYPILSSYYWRSLGMAHEAMECARRALFLVPRKYKDIALLSVGTILQRSNYSHDAVVALNAAADHAPNVAENQIALANGHFLLSDFNKSIECYKNAKNLDPSYAEKETYMRKSMTCFRYIKTKLQQIERELDDMRSDLVSFVKGRDFLDKYYEKLLREQVPISARLLEPSFNNHSHHLSKRGQYCSIRKTQYSQEPVLFCDFYSDLQMELNKDSTIDKIQNYVESKTEFVMNQYVISLGVYKHLDIEEFQGDLDVKQDF